MPSPPLDFRSQFQAAFRLHIGVQAAWEVEGILTKADTIIALGFDTKVLSTIFELLTAPIITIVASAIGYEMETSTSQTVYPDFTLTPVGQTGNRIAVDVKSTYRRSGNKAKFTLGSYTSFLRNNTKNIVHPYSEYAEHWIIGFVYDRHSNPTVGIIPLAQRGRIIAPVKNVELVIARKEWIASDSPGSGNTTNIGSVFATVPNLNAELGTFATFSNPRSAFEEYWRHFESKRDATLAARTRSFSNIEEFKQWYRPSP